MKRSYLRVRVSIESPWRTGIWGGSAARTQATARHPLQPDQPMVSGTTVAGSLREAARQLGKDVTLFGSLPGDDDLTPSTWWVLGVRLGDSGINERTQTAIDRNRRAAANRSSHSSEYADPTSMDVYLRADDSPIEELIEVIASWQPRIGGSSSSGMGLASVNSVVAREFDLDRREDVLALLSVRGAGPDRIDELLRSEPSIDVPLMADAPLIRADFSCGEMAIKGDAERVTRGSTWKGILRSRVEYIARTCGHPACMSDNQDWTGCGSDDCALCAAFGSSETGIGALEFADSDWEGDGTAQIRTRIAIDRFTGGVRKGLTFGLSSVSEIRLTLEIRQRRQLPDWVQHAVLHAIRDVSDGLVGIGPLGAIGMGRVTLDHCEVNGVAGVSSGQFDLQGMGLPKLPAFEGSKPA